MPRKPDIKGKNRERFPSMLGTVYVSADGVEREKEDSEHWDTILTHFPDQEVLQNDFIHWEQVVDLKLVTEDRYYPYITLVLNEEEFDTGDDLDRSLNYVKHVYFVDKEETGKQGWEDIHDCYTAMKKKFSAYMEKYGRSGHLTVEYEEDTDTT